MIPHAAKPTIPYAERNHHSRAFSFRRSCKPRGHVVAIHKAPPSEASDLGPRTSRKYVPQTTATPQTPFQLPAASVIRPHRLNTWNDASVSGISKAWITAPLSRQNQSVSFRQSGFPANHFASGDPSRFLLSEGTRLSAHCNPCRGSHPPSRNKPANPPR